MSGRHGTARVVRHPRASRSRGRPARRHPGRGAVLLVAAALSAVLHAGREDGQAGGADDRPPLSPEEALATFVLEPGYRIEIAAAEPLVQSPVAVAFDESGGMYVAENRGYPDPLAGEPVRPPEGVIARLTDTDGDGRYDARTEFATGLTYPNGVLPWNGGVLVTAAPDLLFLKDTTGDGVADERRVVLTGFNTTSTAQIRVSHPTLGLDNWVYLTSGLNGGTVTVPDRPERPALTFQPSDSRVHPRTLDFELTGGRSQFCQTFDNAGRRFTCANRQPLWHVVLEARHLARHPAYAFSQTVQEVAPFGADAPVWPISRDLTTASLSRGTPPHAGTFTAASGAYLDRGTALAPGHAGSVFLCESAQNLVQRQVITPEGASFKSRAAREGADFLASRDTWFRPVFATGGPDGALYVVDMYRKDIDHPSYVPEASRPRMDVTAGKTRGRIYRVVATGWQRPPAATTTLAAAPAAALVAALDHPNGWHRDTAQRLLVERQDRSAVPLLAARAERPGAPGRVHALWTLDGFGALEARLVARALADPDADVRENALRLAEPRVASSAALADAVVRAAADPEARVRLQAALAVGNLRDARSLQTLAAMARGDGHDRWLRAAVISGLDGRASDFLTAFIASRPPMGTYRPVVQELAQVVGAAETLERCAMLASLIADPDAPLAWQRAALEALATGLRNRKLAGASSSHLLAAVSGETAAARAARARVEAVLAHAAAIAVTIDAPVEDREAAVGLLALGEWNTAQSVVMELLEPRQPAAVQQAAVRTLGQIGDAAGLAALIAPARWQSYTPQVRESVLSMFVSRESTALRLLDAIARGDVAAAALGPARRTRLENHRNPAIQARARSLFAAAGGTGREAFTRLQPQVRALTGDAGRGRALFEGQCRVCHTFSAPGGQLGPDLSGLGGQTPDAILLHVLAPDAEITAGYETYSVELRTGQTLVGRVESETPQSITLREAASGPRTVLRADVAAITLQPGSLMPAGFEQTLPPQALADLIAYLTAP